MNLHILPDSKFSNTFYSNLSEASLLYNNKCVVRSNQKSLKYVDKDLPFAHLYSKQFDMLTGSLGQYNKVFIHQLHPLMYRWVARNSFNELHWMVWGTDLYNLPFVSDDFYEPLTRRITKKSFHLQEFLLQLKIIAGHLPFRKEAYSKIRSVLTWMQSEYLFAKSVIPELNAQHHFFFYENQVPYEQLDSVIPESTLTQGNRKRRILLGNSGTPTNNHLDGLTTILSSITDVEVFIPVSYGDVKYISLLREKTRQYGDAVKLIDDYMPFAEYLGFLNSMDGLVMNNRRPQGYGNIFMMMYLRKPVFINKANLSLVDLRAHGFEVFAVEEMRSEFDFENAGRNNAETVRSFLSHERLLETYRKLFT